MQITGVCKVVPVLSYAPRHEDVWESGGIVPPFLTLALGGGEEPHAPAALPPGKIPRY
jgi:hypothetical protein